MVDNSANKSNQRSESTGDDQGSTNNASVNSSEYTNAKEEEAGWVIHEASVQTDITTTPIANKGFDTEAAASLMRANLTDLAITISSGDSVRRSRRKKATEFDDEEEEDELRDQQAEAAEKDEREAAEGKDKTSS